MKVVAIGVTPLDLDVTCFGTLSKCIKDGHETHIIIVDDRTNRIDTIEGYSKIGVYQVHVIERFDYSSVTQANADALSLFIKKIEPSFVIMPFWKSYNNKRRILARTSLIACRGIANVLMYELEENRDFVPNIYFTIPKQEYQLKKAYIDSTLTEQKSGSTSMKRNELANLPSLSHSPTEGFESHRMLLVENDEL